MNVIPYAQKNQHAKLGKEITGKLSALKNERSKWEPEWQEIADYVAPRRADFNETTNKGKRHTTQMYDGTAASAAQLLADGLQGYLTSSSSRWFRLTLPGSEGEIPDDAKEWLEEIEKIITDLFDRSNFYDSISQIFFDGVTIGTACLYTELDWEKKGLWFSSRHPKEIYIAVDKYGQVDTVFRVYKQTKRNILDDFGDGLSEAYKESAKNSLYDEDTLYHAVFPRKDRKAFKVDKINKKFASIYYLKEEDQVLSIDGYDELPYNIWRYRVNTGEEYGRSPSWSAISDIKVAQQIMKSLLIKAQLSVEGAWAAPQELKNTGLILRPKGITYLTDMNRVPKPLLTGESYPIGKDMQEIVQLAIKEHFRVDFFLMLSQMAGKNMTATQVLEMQGEKAAIMSTMVSRLSSEFFNPLFDRVFALIYRAGWLPDPPASVIKMQGRQINVDYIGPLSQAVKRHFNTQAFKQSIFEFAELSNIFPRMLKLLDEMGLGRELLEQGGVPEKIIRDAQAVVALEEQEAQLQAQQQAMINEAQGADVLQKLSTAPESGSLAEELISV